MNICSEKYEFKDFSEYGRARNSTKKGAVNIHASSLCINNVHYIIRKVVGDRKAKTLIEENESNNHPEYKRLSKIKIKSI